MIREDRRTVRKYVGPVRAWTKPWWIVLSLVLVVAAGVATVLAVHDTGAFELDGNADVQDTVPPLANDWADIFNQTSSARSASFTDDGSLNATIFSGGGSKDPIDINQWAWKDGAGGLPDKDNLLHSFAARYSMPASANCPGGGTPTCDVLFFGSDRYDNSGDAQQGFWFFQNPVGTRYDTNGDGTPDTDCPQRIGGGTGFCDPRTGAPATHLTGDLLIISNFSNGGTTSTISVYIWDSTVNGNLRLLQSSAAANCTTAPPNDPFCGIVNPGPNLTNSPWPFLDKSGNTAFANGEFYEGGVNLSLLGLSGECFASVASETRSSTSTTATLKDFVLGGFASCQTGLVTTPKDGNGAAITGGLSIGNGSVQARDSAVLTVSGAANWTGNLKFFLCGPIASATETCATGGTQIGAAAGITVTNVTPQPILSDPATLTSAGRYCWRGDFTSGTSGVPNASDSSLGECFNVNPAQPAIITSATGPVLVGSPISDSATLSFTATRPSDPVINTAVGIPATGLITFHLYGPNDTTCSGAPAFTATATVNGNGSYSSGSFTPSAAGTYRWVASYSGDSPNTLPVAGACNDTGETSVVNPVQPTISTNASAAPPTGAPVGTALNDVATLGGTVAPSNGIFGTITFRAYGPHDNTTTCTNLAYTSVVTITGNGAFNSATGSGGTFTPTAPGNYNWIASYAPDGGDGNNLAVSGSCGDANEGSLISRLDPTVTTAQFFYPNDSATITVVSGGGNLAGNARFRVWLNDATCTTTALYDQTIAISGALTRTVETTNTTARVNGVGGLLYWKVDYTSTNPAHSSVTGTCGTERSTISINNNFTTP